MATLGQKFTQAQIDSHDFSNEDLGLKVTKKYIDYKRDKIVVELTHLYLEFDSTDYVVIEKPFRIKYPLAYYRHWKNGRTKNQAIQVVKDAIKERIELYKNNVRDDLKRFKSTEIDLSREEILITDQEIN